jgi:hypothetical protein
MLSCASSTNEAAPLLCSMAGRLGVLRLLLQQLWHQNYMLSEAVCTRSMEYI